MNGTAQEAGEPAGRAASLTWATHLAATSQGTAQLQRGARSAQNRRGRTLQREVGARTWRSAQCANQHRSYPSTLHCGKFPIVFKNQKGLDGNGPQIDRLRSGIDRTSRAKPASESRRKNKPWNGSPRRRASSLIKVYVEVETGKGRMLWIDARNLPRR